MPDTTVKIEDYMQELEKPQPDIMQEWQTSKKPVYDIIMSRYPKPEKEIDPETERRAKFASSLSDGLVSIGEMFAHGSGARVKSRAGQPTSTGTTNASIKSAEDKYASKLERYQAADSNAKLQDLNTYLSQAQQERGEKRKMYLYKAEQAEKAKAAAMAERKQKETERHNRVMENKPTGSAKDDKTPKTLPVYVNNRQHDFPADLMEEVVARAIKDGVAGTTTVETADRIGNKTKKNIPIQPNTPLSVQQKQQIFQSVYPRYLQEGENGKLLIRRGLSAYDKKSGVTAQEKWKMPKQPNKTSSGSLY